MKTVRFEATGGGQGRVFLDDEEINPDRRWTAQEARQYAAVHGLAYDGPHGSTD